MKKIIANCLSSVLAAACSMGATHYVATNGPGPAPFTSWETAASTIQEACDAASEDGVIVVAGGVYDTGGADARVSITNNGLKLLALSTNPSDTVIVGERDPATEASNPGIGPNAKRCLYINARDVTVSGFTLSNGWSTSATRGGGGLYVIKNPLLVTNCHVVDCVGAEFGAAVQQRQTTLATEEIIFTHCLFERNSNWHEASQSYGGAAANVTLIHCTAISNTARIGGATYNCPTYASTIAWNTARDGGGSWHGIHSNTLFAHNATLESPTAGQSVGGAGQRGSYYNCVIVSNYSYRGRTLDLRSNAEVVNCLIAYNTGGAIAYGAAVGHDGAQTNINVINCTITENSVPENRSGGAFYTGINVVNGIVWNNWRGAFVDNWDPSQPGFTYAHTLIAPLPEGAADLGGNANEDPLFANALGGDFQLQRGSPALNTGTNADWMASGMDLDGRMRIDRFSGIVDMGCYENYLSGTMFMMR